MLVTLLKQIQICFFKPTVCLSAARGVADALRRGAWLRLGRRGLRADCGRPRRGRGRDSRPAGRLGIAGLGLPISFASPIKRLI